MDSLNRFCDDPRMLQAVYCLLDSSVRNIEYFFHSADNSAVFSCSSRRIFSFMKFLAEKSNFNTLCSSVKILRETMQAGADDSRLQKKIYFIPSNYLYKIGNNSTCFVHAAFINAPERVLGALAVNFQARIKPDISAQVLKSGSGIIREYACSEKFLLSSRAINKFFVTGDSAAGRYYDLLPEFDNLNKIFFSGSLHHPLLVWSRKPTRRKFGHYDPVQDIIMISRTLDNPQVHPEVLRYVLYHEMLHKYFSGKNRWQPHRRVHNKEFRASEKLFPEYRFAENMLAVLSSRQVRALN
ncbi:MAG: hypothetical protein A2096_03230 [Spirochaetes bacterium GWF1_41_5]|nr:MAG: hypothetical protein A2096_03230 [Spirochaetes bacterium GWF1_41_5]HBE02014.1 hypothetical protein [Spirochaetia bacterium]